MLGGLGFGVNVLREEAEKAVDDGLARFEAGDVDGARERFEAALVDDPAHLEARTQLGIALFKLERYEAAAREWKAVLDAAQTAARQAGLDDPLNGETDIDNRLAEVSAEDQDSAAEQSSSSTAGELAAAALASTISAPDLGGNEVLQVVR